MNQVKRSKDKYFMETYLGGYWKYAWICMTCGRAWISREVAQKCHHEDSYQTGYDRFISPIKIDEDINPQGFDK